MTTNNQYFTQSGFPQGGNETGDRFGTTLIAGNFNGYGTGDVVIGTPYEDNSDGTSNIGKVNVLNGSSSGLTSTGSQLFLQNTLSGGYNESYDYFGKTLAVGDFNNDGKDDVVIGTPNENWGSIYDSGIAQVMYGSNSGLTSTGSQVFTQTSFPSGGNEAYDRFASSLSTGDYNGDGFDDLAIGAPGEDLENNSVPNAGKVNVLNGSVSGLTSTGSQLWDQTAFPSGGNEAYDGFGYSLASGDFDGDGKDDLAIGTPDEDLESNSVINTGKVNVLNGSASGLTRTNSQLWDQTAFPLGGNENYDGFGEVLATGDFNNDGFADLAVGTPKEDYTGGYNTGKVNILYGSNSGLTSTDSQFWQQDDLTGSGSEAYDYFGEALAVGDFDNDGYDDLAVGTPGEDIFSVTDAGAVNIIYGSNGGLSSTGSQFWSQDSPGVRGVAEKFDRFGASLTVEDFNGDGYDDLAIGVPGEDVGSITNSGVVQILYGSSSGLIV